MMEKLQAQIKSHLAAPRPPEIDLALYASSSHSVPTPCSPKIDPVLHSSLTHSMPAPQSTALSTHPPKLAQSSHSSKSAIATPHSPKRGGSSITPPTTPHPAMLIIATIHSSLLTSEDADWEHILTPITNKVAKGKELKGTKGKGKRRVITEVREGTVVGHCASKRPKHNCT